MMIDVVAAILQNHKGEILIAKRKKGKVLEGYWEFPGGKVENAETLEIWNDVVLTGFEMPKELLSDFFSKTFSFMLLNDTPSASAFLAYYNGDPVASSVVCYEAGVAGIYNVTLRVSDGNDSDEQEFTITVEENGSVGIEKALLKDQLLLYPNPTDGRFFLELPGVYEEDLTFEIFDQTGKLFLQQVFPSHTQIRKEFDLSSEPPGIYFIRVYLNSDQMIGKLILH